MGWETDAQAPDSVWQAIRPAYRPLAQILSDIPAEYPTSGNTVEIIRNGEQKLGMLIRDILDARRYVHMEYFEFLRDHGSYLVRSALMLKGMDGLEVRYIEEDFLNIPHSNYLFNSMRHAGVQVEHFSPFWCNRRNHQKIVTIDDAIAYTGGMNVGNHYWYEWDDTHLRLTGPCVQQLEALYERMWRRVKGKPSRASAHEGEIPAPEVPEDAYRNVVVQVMADEPEVGHAIMESYIWMLDHCQDYLYIQTPYFTPPQEVMGAMKRAVARGLDLRLLIPAVTDMKVADPANRSYYKECLEAGIRIFESSGRFNHGKVFVADDYVSSAGSANVDGRSLKHNYENNTYFYDTAVSLDFKRQLLLEFSRAHEVTLEEVESWSFGKRLGNSLCRILGPEI